jgi:4-amino-4-deoxy-L-arabinose transferase-like glycosyltransferase
MAPTRQTLGSPALWLGGLCFVIHIFANPHYGVFRDELYFIVCGEHFAFGYVDQPPLIPWIAAASHALFGLALTPLRLLPALAMAATVALTAEYTGLIGGGRFAQALAALCVLAAPVLLVDGVLLSTDMLHR